MTGTGAGNIGIGDNNPAYKFTVAGTGSFSGFRLTTGATAGYVLTTDASGNASWQAAASSGWGFAGNAITLGQFIGTTNNQDLVFKRNNIESFRLSGASGNLVTTADAMINGVTVGR